MTELPEGTVLFELRGTRKNGQTVITFDAHPDAKLHQIFTTLEQLKLGVLQQANNYFKGKGFTPENPAGDEDTEALTYRMIEEAQPPKIIEVKPQIISLNGK